MVIHAKEATAGGGYGSAFKELNLINQGRVEFLQSLNQKLARLDDSLGRRNIACGLDLICKLSILFSLP